MLLFLMLLAYVLLLWLGVPLWWSLCIMIFIGLLYLGLRYPRGKADWRYSFRESLYMVMTLITMIIFVSAIQAALANLGGNLPSEIEILLFFIVMPAMMIFFVLGLFFPHGKTLKLRNADKTDSKTK
jgi:hypothetical protein